MDKAYEGLYAMADPAYNWQEEPKKKSTISFITSVELNFEYLAKLAMIASEEACHKIHDLYMRTVAEQTGCRIIISLRRFKDNNGYWPNDLQDMSSDSKEILIDPVNNDSFVYKLIDDGFMFYSKGRNKIDENGELDTTWTDYKADDWLIWPPRNSKKAKKNADSE